MKTTQSRTVAMSDMFRALAGCPEAQFDMIACTVYSAAYSIMLAGNKTQFNKLESDASMYGTSADASKTIRALFGIKTMNAAAKHFQRTYYAVSEALRQCGIPSDMQKDLPQGRANEAARHAILDPLAQDYADQFTAIFTAVMIMPVKTEDERTAAAAAREAKKAEKEAEAARAAQDAEREQRLKIDAEVKARVERAVEATEKELERVTAPNVMALTVADMLRSGTLPSDLEALLIEAAQQRETALLLARAASAEPVTV